MELRQYLDRGVSPYQVVDCVRERLEGEGFVRLAFDEHFALVAGGRYYVMPYEGALFAFVTGNTAKGMTMHVACAHTDVPCLKLKCHPQVICTGKPDMVQANVELYGGMRKKTWMDRPLGLAGKVMLRTENPYAPRTLLFDSGEPWFILPSLAPHMDREIDTKDLDAQKEMLPLCLTGEQMTWDTDRILQAVAEKLHCEAEEILDYDLYLYNAEPSCQVGLDGRMLSSARIDNVASVAALTEGLIAAANAQGEEDREVLHLIALFDHEEIGSRSKQGADSMLLSWVTEKILESTFYAGCDYKNAMAGSMLLSVDGAHAMHPGYREKSDPTNPVVLGGGVVLKTSATQRYVTDSRASAIVKGLCAQEGILLQQQVNRSGLAGGQTLGPITASYLPVLAADIGLPMLAMHSARELCHEADYAALRKLITIWFS